MNSSFLCGIGAGVALSLFVKFIFMTVKMCRNVQTVADDATPLLRNSEETLNTLKELCLQGSISQEYAQTRISIEEARLSGNSQEYLN